VLSKNKQFLPIYDLNSYEIDSKFLESALWRKIKWTGSNYLSLRYLFVGECVICCRIV